MNAQRCRAQPTHSDMLIQQTDSVKRQQQRGPHRRLLGLTTTDSSNLLFIREQAFPNLGEDAHNMSELEETKTEVLHCKTVTAKFCWAVISNKLTQRIVVVYEASCGLN